MAIRTRTAIALGASITAALAACGDGGGRTDSGYASSGASANGASAAQAPTASGESGALAFLGDPEPRSIVVDCGVAQMTVIAGQRQTVTCRAIGTMRDGSTVDVSASSRWGIDDPSVAALSPTGALTAYGTKGGKITVTAWRGNLTDSVTLDVDLAILSNTANVGPVELTTLRSAKTAASGVTWAYPYDKTVFPRGLPAPELMWNGGPDASTIYILLEAPNATLETVVKRARPGKALISEADWQAFEGSAEGFVKVTVKALVGSSAQVLASNTWTIASGSLRGTVYYWAVNAGRVVRLKPGRSAPEDFMAGVPGMPSASCTSTCHTISANGATMLSGGDGLGGTFDLGSNRILKDNGGSPYSNWKRRFAYGGVSADGRFVTESYAPWPVGFADQSGSGGQGGLFDAKTLGKIANSGLDGVRLGTPSWAADDKMLAFMDYYISGRQDENTADLKVMDWNPNIPRATGIRTIMTRGSGQPIHYPSLSPDHKFVTYHRGGLRTDGGNRGDLFLAFTAPGPQKEVRLAAANGDGAVLPGGAARDLAWNFEPTFAPRAAGGYFWAVFTSRRVYGNELTAYASRVKQLWVTAIDINATPGKDPSHPAFRLPGQANTLNLRGFWALDACKANTSACGDGTECCGGYCVPDASTGGTTCASAPPACSRDGDRCENASDCCNTRAKCIVNTCSAPPPVEELAPACMTD